MLLLFCFYFHFFQHYVQALPQLSPDISVNVDSASPATCSSPDSRSIWDIVWSCLVTIFACSWVAVHPDIPAPDDKWWKTTLRRIEYMFWTIMTPELMIYWAARQWFGVRYFFSYPFHGAFNEGIRRHKWTHTHAHFLQMGGFTLFDSNGESKGVLSRDRFRTLLERKKINFPDITVKEIEDRSKSDSLAKILVVGQTAWFILQVIVRKIQGWVITEIEIATLAFAALNAVMYFFWWDKPFDVQTSVPIYLISEEPKMERIDSEDVLTTSKEPSFALNTNCVGDPTFDGSPSDELTNIRSAIHLSLHKHIRWPLQAISFISQRLHNLTENFHEFDAFQSIETAAVIAPSRVPQFYAIISTEREEILMNTCVAILGAVFGAIHCAAWSFVFPTNIERYVWRVGSLVITGVPVAFLMLLAATGGILKPGTSAYTPNSNRTKKIVQIRVIPFLFRTLAPLYAVARLSLVVEAIITLRKLPPGAFGVVKWTTFLPHI